MRIIGIDDPTHEPLAVVRLARAAELLAISERTLQREIKRGRIRTIGRGHLRRVALADIRAYQEQNAHVEAREGGA
jgi:excisionase family DNA binding protein